MPIALSLFVTELSQQRTDMRVNDLTEEVFQSLRGHLSRTLLTMLGIVIGIASVIGMLGLGQGASNSIQSQITSLGANSITVMSGEGASLADDDVEALRDGLSDDVLISPTSSSRHTVSDKGESTTVNVYGTDEHYAYIKGMTLAEGRYFSETEARSSRKVVVLGSEVKKDLFGSLTNPVGRDILIDNVRFSIVGVMEAQGGSGFGSTDDIIFTPLQTSQDYLTGSSDLASIELSYLGDGDIAAAEEKAISVLREQRDLNVDEEDDFTVMNQQTIADTVSTVTSTLTALLGAIAGISLLVGGIGIMNMMLTSVTERTKEIGLRKAVGAKARDITQQFLAEAVVMTAIGGVIGLLVGWFLSVIGGAVLGFSAGITLNSALLAIGVASMIGIVFGYYPARTAANLQPIEALRHD